MLAAGVLCWRPSAGGLQVLLVRSVRHDEWSWPKGRLEPGETLPECAVREALEETGLRVVLGLPLPSAGYTLPDGRAKVVSYWAARVDPSSGVGSDGDGDAARVLAPQPPAGVADEIAELAWVSVDRAAGLLPHPEHHLPLAELVALAGNHRLDTRPVLVLRHASARSRQAWGGAEGDRPLSGKGRRQAAALPALLACWRPTRLLSSPWRRCTDTISAYGRLEGVTLVTDPGLSESGHRRSPAVAAGRLEELVSGHEPALLCSHRPVLRSLFAVVEGHAAAGVAAALPTRDPFLRPAELLLAHLVPDRDERQGGWGGWAVAAFELHRPCGS